MGPISNTGSVPKTVTWYWHFVCTETFFFFSKWWDILQKSASTSWCLTVTSWNFNTVSKNLQLLSNFSTHQFWSQKQPKTNWAHFFEHKEQWAPSMCRYRTIPIRGQKTQTKSRSYLPCHSLYPMLVHWTYHVHLDFLQKYVKLDLKSWKSVQTSRRVNPMKANLNFSVHWSPAPWSFTSELKII